MISRRLLATTIALVAALPATAADAAPRLRASFAPTTPGRSTTITIGFDVGVTATPLVALELRLPNGVTAGFNTLGVATCDPDQLTANGPSACPRNSLVGWGNGTVSVPVGLERVTENVNITIFMAPASEERTAMLFYVRGLEPVISLLVFHGSVEGDEPPFGAQLDASIPPVAALPGSPGGELISMTTKIGPQGLKYYKQVHGRTVSYRPQGYDVPPSCPRGGYPFAGEFTFADGSHQSGATRVPCPRKGRRR